MNCFYNFGKRKCRRYVITVICDDVAGKRVKIGGKGMCEERNSGGMKCFDCIGNGQNRRRGLGREVEWIYE